MLFWRGIKLAWWVHCSVGWLHSCLTMFKCLEVTLIRLLVGGLFDGGLVEHLMGWGFILLEWRLHGGDDVCWFVRRLLMVMRGRWCLVELCRRLHSSWLMVVHCLLGRRLVQLRWWGHCGGMVHTKVVLLVQTNCCGMVDL